MEEDKATAAAAEGDLQAEKDRNLSMRAKKGKVNTEGEEKMIIDKDTEE